LFQKLAVQVVADGIFKVPVPLAPQDKATLVAQQEHHLLMVAVVAVPGALAETSTVDLEALVVSAFLLQSTAHPHSVQAGVLRLITRPTADMLAATVVAVLVVTAQALLLVKLHQMELQTQAVVVVLRATAAQVL
jgi:hypothetical protein